MRRLNWKFIRPSTKTLFTVPSTPGVYAFIYNHLIYDLLIQRDVIYVGKSINLRRRLREHIVNETNDELKGLKLDEIHFAFCQLDESNLSWVESTMYRVLKPQANRISPPTGDATEEFDEINPKLIH